MRAIVALLTATLSVGIAIPACSQTSQDSPHLTPRNGVVTAAPADPPPVRFVSVPQAPRFL